MRLIRLSRWSCSNSFPVPELSDPEGAIGGTSEPTYTFLGQKTVTANVNIGDYVICVGYGQGSLQSAQFTFSGAEQVLREERTAVNGSSQGYKIYFVVLKATTTSVYVWHNLYWLNIYKMTLS